MPAKKNTAQNHQKKNSRIGRGGIMKKSTAKAFGVLKALGQKAKASGQKFSGNKMSSYKSLTQKESAKNTSSRSRAGLKASAPRRRKMVASRSKKRGVFQAKSA